MDMMWNVISRAKAVWKAASTRTEQEQVRRDSIGNAPPIQYSLDPQPPSEELQHFRLLVGIVQDRSFRAPNGFNPNSLPVNVLNARPAPNMGIYTRVYADEIKCKKNYKFASRLINTCLGVQIVVAAALTALGAANKNGGAITTFGAINTVIAGFLTYLKGSGLPHRIKYFQHEWSKVREYIEQRERDLQCGIAFDVIAEVQVIRAMYEAVKQDVEANRPDRFVGVGSVRPFGGPAALTTQNQQHLQQPQAVFHKTASDATSEMRRFSDTMHASLNRSKSGVDAHVRALGDLEKGYEAYGKNWFNEKQGEVTATAHRVQHVGSQMFDDVRGLKGRLEEKMKEIGHLEKELEVHSRNAVEEKKRATKTALDATVREVEGVGREIEAYARATATHEGQVVRDAVAEHASSAKAAASDAEAAVNNGVAAAQKSLAEREEVARAAVAAQEARSRTATHDFLDRAFDEAGGRTSGGPHDTRGASSP